MDFKVPNGECLSGSEQLESRDARVPLDHVAGRGRDVDRNFQANGQRSEAIDVVPMFMGDENRIATLDALAHRTQARGRFLAAKPCVHQQARLLGSNPGRISPAPTSQNANPQAQSTTLCSSIRTNRREPPIKLGGNYKAGRRNPKAKTVSAFDRLILHSLSVAPSVVRSVWSLTESRTHVLRAGLNYILPQAI